MDKENASSVSWPDSIQWVGQDSKIGCGFAVCEMITGCTKEDLDRWFGAKKKKMQYFELDAFLAIHGFSIMRRSTFETFDKEWPPRPFAPAHYAVVILPGDFGHFVVMLKDGTVYDPMEQTPKRLRDFQKVESVTGIFDTRDTMP